MKIAIDQIKIVERIRKEINRIPDLAGDIEKNGLLHPVTVMPIDGGGYQLLAGLRRIKAAESLGWTEIEANIITPADAEAALQIEISENEQREQFTYSEKMDFARLIEEIVRTKAIKRMLSGKKSEITDPTPHGAEGSVGETRKIVAAKLGMGKTSYDRAKYIADNAPPEVIEQLDKGEISIRRTYDELRAKEKDTAQPVPPDLPPPKPPRPRPAAADPMDYMSDQDKEAIRRLREFDALPPEGKIAELQRQLKEERARAATAESELTQLTERHHSDVAHRDSIIESLKRQLAAANARIDELEAREKTPPSRRS